MRKSVSWLILGFMEIIIQSVPSPLFAYDWIVRGSVTSVEASYVPNAVTFTMDVGAGSCVAGSWLTWDGAFNNVDRASNVKSMLDFLTAALFSGKQVELYGLDAGCKGQYIHLLVNQSITIKTTQNGTTTETICTQTASGTTCTSTNSSGSTSNTNITGSLPFFISRTIPFP